MSDISETELADPGPPTEETPAAGDDDRGGTEPTGEHPDEPDVPEQPHPDE